MGECFKFCFSYVSIPFPIPLSKLALPYCLAQLELNFMQLELDCIYFSTIFFFYSMLSFKDLNMFLHMYVLSHFSHIQIFETLWTVAQQALLSMEFSKKAYWSGFPWPSPRDVPNTGIEPASPVSLTFAGEFFTTIATWEAPFVHIALILYHCFKIFYLVNVL